MAEKKRIFSFDVVKLIAMLLVLNSHFDPLYPGRLKLLAMGGTWGNALFFLISGYFTSVSGGFLPYMKRKVIRIYPSVIIFTVISLILSPGDIIIKSAMDVVFNLVWPTSWWFIGALVLYYILLYLAEKIKAVSSHFTAFSLVFAALFLGYYVLFVSAKDVWCIDKMGFEVPEDWLKVFMFFYVFAMGYYIKENGGICHKISSICSVCLIIFGGLGYMASKQILLKGLLPMRLQIASPVLLYAMVFGVLCLTSKCAEKERGGKGLIEKLVTFLSLLSLEVYMVQFAAIRVFENVIFPLNVIAVLLATFFAAYLLNRLSKLIADRLR